MKYSDKKLGLGSNITRRDFLNSSLLGTGGALLLGISPLVNFGCTNKSSTIPIQKNAWSGYGAIGDYANSAGNTMKAMNAAHKIRDGVYNAPKLDAKDTQEIYDLIVIGGGMSGLGAAHYFKKNADQKQRCLLLENHSIFGGAAKRNEFMVNGSHLTGPQASNDFAVPQKGSETIADIAFDELNIPREFEFAAWNSEFKPLNFALDNYAHMTGVVESKVDIGYYFDKKFGVSSPKWMNNIWRNDLYNTPFSDVTKANLLKWRYAPKQDITESHLRVLDSMTYQAYLENVLGFSKEVTKYIEPVIGLINGASADAVSAFSAYQIGMPGTGRLRTKETSLPYSFPGGNSAFARFLVKDLIPTAIKGGHNMEDILNQNVNFDKLDNPENKVRMRLDATAVRIEHEGEIDNADLVKVDYEKDGVVYQAKARSVIMASGGWVNRHILYDLPKNIKDAYSSFNHAPALVANVALTNWRFMYKLGITAARWFNDGFGFSCNIRRPMVVGGEHAPLDPDKPVILTFYMGYPEANVPLKTQCNNARWKIFGTSFLDYEKQLRYQMLQMFGSAGFNAEKDIAGIVLNRWGHARLAQQPGFYFGDDENPAARDVVAKGYGKIVIGHSELNGHQNWTGGLSQGYGACKTALERIG